MLIEIIAKLWDRWKINDAKSDLWTKFLLPLDFRRAKNAIQSHRAESKLIEPCIADVKTALATHQQSTTDGRFGATIGDVGHSGVWVHRDDYYHEQELIYASPASVPSRDKVLRAAEALRAQCHDLYRRDYRVTQDVDYTQIMTMREGAKLREPKQPEYYRP